MANSTAHSVELCDNLPTTSDNLVVVLTSVHWIVWETLAICAPVPMGVVPRETRYDGDLCIHTAS